MTKASRSRVVVADEGGSCGSADTGSATCAGVIGSKKMWMLIADFGLSKIGEHAYVHTKRCQRRVAAIDGHRVRRLHLLGYAAGRKARWIEVRSAEFGEH